MPDHAAAGQFGIIALAHHRLSVQGRAGALRLAFSADFSAPWTVIFGPSGCGKSTLLRSMCGLVRGMDVCFARRTPEGAWAYLQDDRASAAPEHRHIAYSPQHAVLFPHLSVRDNVGFATAVRPRDPAHATLVAEAMTLFGLEPLAHKFAGDLSGGERQRVSLARALAVPDAHVLLLDEPFAGIDRALRDDLIPKLQTWCQIQKIPVISVTHDVDEVFLLEAEVVRLHRGQVVAQGASNVVLEDEVERMQRALGLAKRKP